MSNLNAASKLVATLNQLLIDTADCEALGISYEAADVLFNVLMAAKGKADRSHLQAMVDERKARNVITHANLAAES
jgi:hypothetical protein